MTDTIPQFLNLSGGRKIAYHTSLKSQASSTGILWANGLRSDMTSVKAGRVQEWATSQGLSFTGFDYSGHGASTGRFEDGTIGAWVQECSAIFNQICKGPQIVVGSSMGGWIVLLVALAHLEQAGVENSRIKGLVLIAPAVDMTEDLMWRKFSSAIRDQLKQTGIFMRPSAYGDGPYPITGKLIEEGRNHLLFNGEKFNTHCPVRILHGCKDADVPWQQSQKLMAHLDNEDVRLDLVEDGEHRLSREHDIERLIVLIAEIRGIEP